MTLPQPVLDLARAHGVKDQDVRSTVTLTQTGRMQTKPGGRWMNFTARQTFATRTCAFDWRARFAPFGAIRVRDALKDGAGVLRVTVFGVIPLQQMPPSRDLTRGELMRYLAELPWVPQAILHNPHLRWRVIDKRTLAVRSGEGETAAEVDLTLDTHGRVVGIYAPDRSLNGKPTPWVGRFADYRQQDGLWLPFSGEVGWVVDGVKTVYWQGKLESWRIE